MLLCLCIKIKINIPILNIIAFKDVLSLLLYILGLYFLGVVVNPINQLLIPVISVSLLFIKLFFSIYVVI